MDKYICKAKRTDNGEWVIGYFIGVAFEQAYLAVQDGNLATWKTFPVDYDTICRSTCVKGSDDKLIFEHDILKCRYEDEYFLTKVYSDGCILCVDVEGQDYDSTAITFADEYEWDIYEDIKVIGNIIDNPELLEE